MACLFRRLLLLQPSIREKYTEARICHKQNECTGMSTNIPITLIHNVLAVDLLGHKTRETELRIPRADGNTRKQN